MTQTASTLIHQVTGQMYAGLTLVLSKAEAHAKENGTDEATYLGWRFSPDMFPLVKQVQIATELPARAISRLADATLPSFADDETSFQALKERVSRAQEVIGSLDTAAIDRAPEDPITFPVGSGEMTLERQKYVTGFIVPNFYFHVTMAYALIRACGVDVGKLDYLGGQPPQ